jgi:hypothetical protein
MLNLFCSVVVSLLSAMHFLSAVCVPLRWSLVVREFLNKIFPGQWIGWDRLISQSPCSLSVTSMYFFLWGYIKEWVVWKLVIWMDSVCGLQMQLLLWCSIRWKTLHVKQSTVGCFAGCRWCSYRNWVVCLGTANCFLMSPLICFYGCL